MTNKRLRRRLRSAELGGAESRRAGRRRRLRRQRHRQLRDAGLRVDARSRAAVGMGRALRRLAVGRVRAAGGAAARRRRSGISAPVAGELPRHRQPRAGAPRITPCSASMFPADSRLPGGGGGVLDGLYNVTPDGRRAVERQLPDAVDEVRRLHADRQLDQPERHGAAAQRPDAAGRFQHRQRPATTTASVRSAVPEWTSRRSHRPTRGAARPSGWVTRVTALGSYTIPKVDVQVSGTFRSDQGGQLAANWTAPNSATVGLNRAVCRPGQPRRSP